MLDSMFALDVSVWEKLLRTVVLYAFLIVALRLSGKRLMAQLTTFDFIVLLLVSNTVQNGLIGDDNSVTGALVGAAALLILNGAIAYLFFRSRRAEEIISGGSEVLVTDGAIDDAALRRQRFTRSDLMIALQDAGVTDVKDVRRAGLEPNGQLLVSRLDDDDPSTAELMRAIVELRGQVDRLVAAQAAQSAEAAQPAGAGRSSADASRGGADDGAPASDAADA